MISKCQNVVINRTKFSDFEDFDTKTQPTENLNLVGYVETTDALGNTVSKNVSVKYPGDMGPRLDNIENIIGIQAFENIDSESCEHKIDCCIACKIADIESRIEEGWDRDEELKSFVESEVERIDNSIEEAKNVLLSPQENTLFVHTALENGSIEMNVSDILAKFDNTLNSVAWSLVIVSGVKTEEGAIYPEITYSGSIESGNYDKRKIRISHGSETKDIVVVINAAKSTSKNIISL